MAIALVIRAMGASPELVVEQRASVTAGPGQVRLALVAAGIQPLDRQVAAGRLPSAAPPPLVGGTSAVARVLDPVAGLERGALLAVLGGALGLGITAPGTFAEEFVAPEEALVPLPAGLDPALAAAGAQVTLCARLALFDHADLRRGEAVLVLGASGGVGRAATALAARHGARVLAAARRPVAAHPGVVPLPLDDLPAQVSVHTGGAGVDVIVNTVGGEHLDAAVRCGGRRCRHVMVGYAAGTEARLTVPLLLAREHRLLGLNVHATPLTRAREVMAEALRDLRDSVVTVPISGRYALTDGAAAYAAAASAPGRVLLTPRKGVSTS